MNTKEHFILLTKAELPATLNCMRSVPADQDGYAPNSKSRTAKRIVGHLIGHPLDLIDGIEHGKFDHRNESEFESYEAAAAGFEADTNRLLTMVDAVDEKTWDEKQVDFYMYGNKLFTRSLRDMCYDFHADLLHHRGQLSTYYRSMGVRNPVIYGMTAEVVEEMMAAKS
jgi:uncharacterized damage-inducible protein DinB